MLQQPAHNGRNPYRSYNGRSGPFNGRSGVYNGVPSNTPQPSLVLDFIDNPTAAMSWISFSRATSAWYFNSSGVLTDAGSGNPRFDYNPNTLSPLGFLIESQRTNLLLNSLADGTNLSTQSVAVSAQAYTLSFYGTGTVTLSGASTAGPLVGTGALNKVNLTFTPSAGSVTFTVSGTVKWANLEVGSSPTSFIATAGAAATRNADIATINTLTPWYNPAEGTIVIEISAMQNTLSSAFPSAFRFDDGTGNNRIAITRNNATTNARISVADGGVSQAAADIGTWTETANVKIALAYKANDFAATINGAVPTTDTSGTVPAVTTLYIGTDHGGGSSLDGWIKKIRYLRSRLTDLQLQDLTR